MNPLIGVALTLAVVLQSGLPHRSLYNAVIAQTSLLIVLLLFLILEDPGLFAIPGFPAFGSPVPFTATSLSTALHARRSLRRPKYVAGDAPSLRFVDRFGVSERELEVVGGVMDGLSNNDIVERPSISPSAVETHPDAIYR